MSTKTVLGKPIDRAALLDDKSLPELDDASAQMITNLRNMNEFDDRVLEAVAAIPRHAFAPPNLWRMAYGDVDLLVGDFFLPKPSIVAKIAQAVVDVSALHVLSVEGTGGYISAVLSLLVNDISNFNLSHLQLWLSSHAFQKLDIHNILQKVLAHSQDLPAGPFDVFVCQSAVPFISPDLLKPVSEGGIFIGSVGGIYGPQKLVVSQSGEDRVSDKDLGYSYFPTLLGIANFMSGAPAAKTGNFWTGLTRVATGAAGLEGEQFPTFGDIPGEFNEGEKINEAGKINREI